VLLGLRLVEGISMSRLEAEGVALDGARIAGLRASGLIAESPHKLAVTQAGRLLLDRITDAVLAD
jgi:coproporphyrinogen III oxidase-like Fe-S oxidoreductase